jgi:hypothetical protein
VGRRSRLVPILVWLGLFVSASGCTASSGPRLVFLADPSVALSLAQSNISQTSSLSFGAMLLCVSGPGTAQLDAVRIDNPQGNILVEAFAVRPNPMPAGDGLGALETPLTAVSPAFDPPRPQLISGVCPEDPSSPTDSEAAAVSELGVQVRLQSGEVGGGRALDVDYEIGGSRKTLTIPFGIWLCAGKCPTDLGVSPAPSR